MSKFKGMKIHVEPVRRDNGIFDYCSKEDTRLEGPWEFGTKPVRRNNKDDWEAIFKLAKEGDIDSIPADIRVKHYNNLQRIKKDNLNP